MVKIILFVCHFLKMVQVEALVENKKHLDLRKVMEVAASVQPLPVTESNKHEVITVLGRIVFNVYVLN